MVRAWYITCFSLWQLCRGLWAVFQASSDDLQKFSARSSVTEKFFDVVVHCYYFLHDGPLTVWWPIFSESLLIRRNFQQANYKKVLSGTEHNQEMWIMIASATFGVICLQLDIWVYDIVHQIEHMTREKSGYGVILLMFS